MWKGKTGTIEYTERDGKHMKKNAAGTPDNMEIDGMKKIFMSSVNLHNLR